MTTIIQYVDIKSSDTLSTYTEKQLEKLNKKFNRIITARVYFKIENNATLNGKICEIDLSISGPKIFASSNEKNFEMAVKETISDLEKQLEKRMTKLSNF
ncbi:ribosome-associated translation inhibitor RaiA [Lacinutrix sp. MedPE-SW]|uniref:ribosome hibernation-promoting factor, HPF/YfiA family n=1 Tax=Lacinutrix sp. MedPE-SW TaxID=1860087 RepID=UPI0009171918|nr:ribosome-associated translation inhibitor RaiA [Lacinutrix sp. MedPE-SW]OIQ18759.1 MAG: ribosomal subunit interface protein [Lacinutrix sp. MedPE-SW]